MLVTLSTPHTFLLRPYHDACIHNLINTTQVLAISLRLRHSHFNLPSVSPKGVKSYDLPADDDTAHSTAEGEQTNGV